jgi:hypothetical protein
MKQLIINQKVYAGYHHEQNCLFIFPIKDLNTLLPLMERNTLITIIENVENVVTENVRFI